MSLSQTPGQDGHIGYFSALKSPLCRKISFLVFLAVIIIEIIILGFSYFSQEKRFLAALEHTGYIAVTSAFSNANHLHDIKADSDPRTVFGLNDIIGLTVFEDGEKIISIGQTPDFSPSHLEKNDVFRKKPHDGPAYDFGWTILTNQMNNSDHVTHKNHVYIRMDTSSVERELNAYVLRITGLVLLISLFVTIVTMLLLWAYILRPILFLQNMYIDPYDPRCSKDFDPEQLLRRDEMGSLFRSFQSMTLDIQQAAKASEHVQKLLKKQVEERTSELENLNHSLNQQIQTTRQSESRFKMYAQSAADWYWEMDEDLRFSFVSNRFREITGVDPNTLIGKTREETGVPGISQDQWEKHLACLKNHVSFREFIHTRTKPDGETVWLSINGEATFDNAGNFTGYQGTGLDITKRQKTAERLETASKAKSEFLSSMSHELRTPLNSILGFSQLLEDDDTPLNDEQILCISNITKAGKHLLELIDQILDLSKIDAGAATFNYEHFYPKEVFKECFEMFREQARERSITMKGIQESDRGVHLDRFRFKQIVINFLSNAIKYAPEGSKITFGCQDLPDSNIYIYVSDSGAGIPESLASEIFSPFERLHHKGSEIEGTGIGLAISKKLTEEMGGSIGYKNESEQNSTFWVKFPGI